MENEIIDRELQKKWESLTFASNFMFWKILTSNPDVCRELIEILLGCEIEKIEMPENEKTMEISPRSHGIRLDVFAKNEKESFDLEIQVVDKNDLPERSRYYQGVLDVDTLPTGHPYTELRSSYVLFLCLFDPFGKSFPVYTFENICKEDFSVRLNDRSYKIFYNAKSCATISGNGGLQNFLEFLNKDKASDGFTSKLKALVEKAKVDMQWRQNFMTLEVLKTYERMDGIKEGLRIGLKQGLEQGLAQGIEQGIEQGSRKMAEQNAMNFLSMGVLSEDQIAKGTGLPLERVRELAETVEH